MNNSKNLERQADKLLHGTKRRKTRRGKKKKHQKSLKWHREYQDALKKQNEMKEAQKKQRAQMFSDFERLIDKE